MPPVFISYKHEKSSTDFALELKAFLGENGFIAFTDHNIWAGEKWMGVIDTAITECFAVLLLVTRKALKSPFVIYEWSFAMGLDQQIIPIIIEPFTDEQLRKVLHPKLYARQYINFASGHYTFEDILSNLRGLQAKYYVPDEVQRAKEAVRSATQSELLDRVKTLAQLEDNSVNEVLAEFLNSANPDVRMFCALKLAERTKFKDLRPISHLDLAVRHHKYYPHGLSALLGYDNEEALQCLWKIFNDSRAEDRHKDIVNTLTKSNNHRVIPFLIEMLHLGQNLPEVAAAFIRLKDSLAVPEILKWLKDHLSANRQYQEMFIRALAVSANSDDEDVLNFLFELAEASVAQDRGFLEWSLAALEEIGGQSVLNGFYNRTGIDRPFRHISNEINQLTARIRAKTGG